MNIDLTNLVNRLYAAALDAGLSPTFPVTLTYGDNNDTNGYDIDIVASMTEPTGKLFANILWLVTDEFSDEYLKLKIRTSKLPVSGMLNSWSDLSTVEDLSVVQYYDDEDAIRISVKTTINRHVMEEDPHPSYQGLTTEGGVLVGKLMARSPAAGTQFELGELIPRRLVVSSINDQTNGFYAILQNFNMTLNSLSNQIATLTKRVDKLEQSSGSLNPSYSYKQDTPSSSWVINHNLGTVDVFVEVWEARVDFEGKTQYHAIVPDEKVIFDENFVIIGFTQDTVGKVNIMAL